MKSNHKSSFIDSLNSVKGVYMEQTYPNYWCSCYVTSNYEYFEADSNGNKTSDEPIYRGNNKVCCCVQTYSGRYPYQDYTVEISQYIKKQDEQLKQTEMTIHKNMNECCSVNNAVFHVQIGQEEIGKVIYEQNSCCKLLRTEIVIDEKILFYIVPTTLWQCGLLCSCPCQSCQEVEFDVIDEDDKKCCKYCTESDDYFSVPFPPNISSNLKALFMAAAIVIDRSYFYNTPMTKEDD